jgi:hypothetical protein
MTPRYRPLRNSPNEHLCNVAAAPVFHPVMPIHASTFTPKTAKGAPLEAFEERFHSDAVRSVRARSS